MNRYPKIIIFAVFAALTAACATFYQKNYKIQSSIANGNLEKADRMLAQDSKWAENNHRVLYYMNRGVVAFLMNDHNKSNEYFNKADYYVEDYSKNIGYEALALVSNPMTKPYRPEDFEAIMVHFFKALNFLALDDTEGALVEARRVNIKLQQLNSKYKDHKNKYQRDAFAHNLMGLIYEASQDHNNAFIAFRNALEIYEEDYAELFGLQAPRQLKKDLLRAAKATGFTDQVQYYENKFEMQAPPLADKDEGELVIFWLNGMGPVKSEWQVTITNYGISGGMVNLGNAELGLNFAYHTNNLSSREKTAFNNLSFMRVAFPKYQERHPVYTTGEVNYKGNKATFDKAQDINQIAFQSLRDRMVRELGNVLLRLATKRGLEELVSNKDENLGTIVSIINAMTEKADTRNWQSLPYSISYARLQLPAGKQTINLNFSGKNQISDTITVNIQKQKTSFFTYHTLKSVGP
jgi:hypothetical protein